MPSLIKQRRATATAWAVANPILAVGEVGWETDTRKAKLGDGSTTWNSLAYAVAPDAVSSVAGRTGAVVLTKTDVGLASVDNTSDANKPVSTAQQTALNLKANLASPALTGVPTAPTAAAGTITTQIATTAFVQTALDYQKFHSWADNSYSFEDYSQAKNLRWFIDSAAYAVTRFCTLYDAEYHNGTSWVTWATGTTDLQPLFDGKEGTGYNVDHTHRRFRVKVQPAGNYPLMTLLLLQSTWTQIAWPGNMVVTVESSTTQNGTYTVRDTATFGSGTTGTSYGWHIRATDSMHTGDVWWRITVEIPDWTDSGGYTTIPLRRLEVVSGYQGRALEPFTWNYAKQLITDGDVVPSTNNARTLGSSSFRWATAYVQNLDVAGTVTGIDKTDVGLSAVDNTSDAGKPVSTAQQTALNLKANLASPALTGTPTAPTAAGGTNTTQIATTAFVTAAIAALINAAPGLLDTLDEIAAALGDDPNFATTMTTALALKAPLASPTFTGTPAATTAVAGDSSTRIATTAFVQNAIANPVGNPYTRRTRASNQSLTNNTWTTVQPGTTDGERGSWSYSSGVVTIPESGLYQINASITFNGHATGRRAVKYRVSGTDKQEARSPANAANDLTLVVVDTIYLTAGATVDVQAYQNSGAALDVLGTASLTTLSIAKIGV